MTAQLPDNLGWQLVRLGKHSEALLERSMLARLFVRTLRAHADWQAKDATLTNQRQGRASIRTAKLASTKDEMNWPQNSKMTQTSRSIVFIG